MPNATARPEPYHPVANFNDFANLIEALRIGPNSNRDAASPRTEIGRAAFVDHGITEKQLRRLYAGDRQEIFKAHNNGQSMMEVFRRALKLSLPEAEELGNAYLLLDNRWDEAGPVRRQPWAVALEQVADSLKRSARPGFAVDEAGMVVLVNQPFVAWLSVIGVPEDALSGKAYLEINAKLRSRFPIYWETITHNIMRWAFGGDFAPLHQRFWPSAHSVLKLITRQFRIVSMTYRHTSRMRQLLSWFWQNPAFQLAWTDIERENSMQESEALSVGQKTPSDVLKVQRKPWWYGPVDNFEVWQEGNSGTDRSKGRLKSEWDERHDPRDDLHTPYGVQTFHRTHLTDAGTLKLFVLEPLSPETTEVINAIGALQGGEPRPFGSWPAAPVG